MDDTIVAVASAAGGAGRGILRLSGCDVVQVLRACFDSPDATALDRSVAWCTEGNLRVAAPLRRVPCLLYLWPDQRSYTRQPSAEIHTLGSPPLLDACLQALCAAGARLARPGEFTLRAFLAGRLDLTQAEAVLGVIEAVSQRQLEVALTQLAGGLSARLQAAREQLLNLCADVEAGLDFVDEDLQFIAPAEIARQLAEIDRVLDHALQQMDLRGERSPQPRVVLTGRPNVGKSTLWNRLLHHHAALVSATPGTTRDYLEDHLELGTTRCTLVDTAGVDPTAPTSAVDRAAQEMTRRNQQQADLIVLCLDPHQPLARWELEQLQSADRPTVFVLTKCDDPASPHLTSWIASLPPAVDVVDQPTVVRLKFAGQRPADLPGAESQQPHGRRLAAVARRPATARGRAR